MTRVTGDIVPSFAVTGVDSGYDMSWNPFRPGSAQTTFTVENTGNASLLITGTAGFGTASSAFPAEGTPRQELLPGESRSFTVDVADVWPTFFVPGTIDVVPTASALGGDPVEVAPQSTGAPLWAIPISQLLTLLGLVLIITALVWRRRRFSAALHRAREEGRRAAPASTVDQSSPYPEPRQLRSGGGRAELRRQSSAPSEDRG